MIRLSRAGWNNILIFSSLIMIFLFNGLHLKIFSNDDDAIELSYLLPADQMILTVDFANLSVERIGRSWRTVPESNHSSEHLHNIIQQWQQLEVQSLHEMPAAANQYPDRVVSFWFAGQQTAFVVQIFFVQGRTVMQTPNGLFQSTQAIEPLIL
ncbi:hypothetical protein DS2_07368 [Catenovulum agarivorans DS-2]|uniref:DUF4340 domain-containing protein n=1 Tax=Catenovulum agarivorans DS-2 TaxID=1328313 RepID=W7QS11_9ALTE|nr:hypothetical protein [Catenovulum agarivorans]EWH10633.1 hypothetical protein DS2_07368 [Catenovulum agarivorans DS-2]